MHLNMNGLGSADGFQFYNSFPMMNTGGEEALSASIEARFGPGISLSEDQIAKISEYAAILDLIDDNEVTDFASFSALGDHGLHIQIIDDLETTEGDDLLGFTTVDGRIFLDSDLDGDAFTAVLTEEIAEAAYYDIFAEHSQGDFGAEVLARLSGTASEEELKRYQTVREDDTFTTEFGEGQAAWAPAWAQNQMAQSFHNRNWWDSGFNWASEIETVAPRAPIITLQRRDADFVKADTRSVNIDNWDGKYDLNNDGILDQYTLMYVGRNSKPFEVRDVRPTDLIPTDQTDTVLFGRGGVSNTWIFKEDRKYSTSEAFKYSEEISVGIESSVDFFGLAEAEVSVEGSIGQETTTTTTREFSVSNEVRKTYQLDPGAYPEGTLVRYGYHMVTADVIVAEEFDAFARIDNAAPGYDQGLRFKATALATVDDYGLGLLATDYDVANQPAAWDLV